MSTPWFGPLTFEHTRAGWTHYEVWNGRIRMHRGGFDWEHAGQYLTPWMDPTLASGLYETGCTFVSFACIYVLCRWTDPLLAAWFYELSCIFVAVACVFFLCRLTI